MTDNKTRALEALKAWHCGQHVLASDLFVISRYFLDLGLQGICDFTHSVDEMTQTFEDGFDNIESALDTLERR